MRMVTAASSTALALAGFLFSALNADAAMVSLSGFVNADISSYPNGYYYPATPRFVNIGGVGFTLSNFGNTSDLGAIQTYQSFYNIPVNQTDVTTVYVIVNTLWNPGYQTNVGTLTFVGTKGDRFTYKLVGGENVRNQFDGTPYAATPPGIFATANFGDVRLDVQQIVLPAEFSNDLLTSIYFSGGFGEAELGSPFLVAATTVSLPTNTVPEPSTWAMLLLGFAGLGFAGYRRAKTWSRCGSTATCSSGCAAERAAPTKRRA
jgi:PEP-CTERM motif